MHYLQKYLEKLPTFKANTPQKVPQASVKKSNISLYCNYYSFYSQKVCKCFLFNIKQSLELDDAL